jgi:putative ABC transport system permease protein
MAGDAVHAAWYAVRSNRIRTLLTAGSVAVGICSVVLLSSMARSGLSSLTAGLEGMGGARLVMVFPKRAEGGRARYASPLTLADVEALRGRIPHVNWISSQSVLGEKSVTVGPGRDATVDVVAGDPHLLKVLKLGLAAGRPPTASEAEAGARVAMLSQAVAARLFAATNRAVGRRLKFDDQIYTVVGVLAPSPPLSFGLGYDLDNLVLLSQSRAAAPNPTQILIGTAARDHNPTVVAAATSILTARHREVDDFRVFDLAVSLDQFKKLLAVIELIAAAIAGVALLGGAAGTTNVLMVSVNEQIREIGVRKALGATGGMVMRQIILQAAITAALGVLAGVVIGLGVLFLTGAIITHFQPGWVTTAATRPIGFAVVTAFAITGVASLLPALKVRNMTVLECLRARA